MKFSLILFIIISLLAGLYQPIHAQDAAGDLLGRINELRGTLGLPGYSLSGPLTAAAQNQASWMATTGQISHTQSDGSTPSSRAAAAGYSSSAVSENIYMGTNATASTAWQWWLNSPIHYRGITNAVYTEVGIAAASGTSGTAFVLVFGNPAGWQAPAIRQSISGGGSEGAAASVPSFVVGVDNIGNIMHEIQPSDTLGDIALIYGYTWDDLEYIRSINGMTEAEGRNLKIGAILLIPPWDGTYTPTPGDPTTAIPEAQATDPAPTAVSLPPEIYPTPTPTIPGEDVVGATSAVVPEWVAMTASAHMTPSITTGVLASSTATPTVASQGVNWTAATVTPTPQVVADANVPPQAAIVETVTVPDENDEQLSPLLMVAIGLQILILGVAGYEFFRRSKS